MLGEIKGRLDTYIAMMESDRKQLWGRVENHEDRITNLEANFKVTAHRVGRKGLRCARVDDSNCPWHHPRFTF